MTPIANTMTHDTTGADAICENSMIGEVTRALVLPAAICLAGLALFWSLPAAAQSFSCAEAERPAEFAVCNNIELLALDEKLGEAFTTVYVAASTAPQRQSVSRQHNEWLQRRNACGADYTCLNLRYEERINALKGPVAVQTRGS